MRGCLLSLPLARRGFKTYGRASRGRRVRLVVKKVFLSMSTLPLGVYC